MDSSKSIGEQLIQKFEYEDKINKFKENIKELYKAGKDTFLTDKVIGDDENVYMHILLGYFPTIVENTWNDYQLGVGIFDMDGFEHRNKESKEYARKYSNNKHNLSTTTINHLWDFYYHTEGKEKWVKKRKRNSN